MTVQDAAHHSRPAAPGACCRFCGGALHPVLDLGATPLCESFLAAQDLNRMEPTYPLTLWVCGACRLLQLQAYVSPEAIFGDYAYFSSYSDAFVAHARDYVHAISRRLRLGPHSQVVELASNDGYLLQHFLPLGVPVLGIEPAANVARAAQDKGVPTRVAFFGRALAAELQAGGLAADLVIGNNVLAQVSDLNDFVAGIAMILAPNGVLTLEFPHVARLIQDRLFDTIYHEHFSYFSLLSAERVLDAHGLKLFDVEEVWTHGGSLRLHACRATSQAQAVQPRVAAWRQSEIELGLDRLDAYHGFGQRVHGAKFDLLEFLITARRQGKRVVGYGAPGKANTLLNFCGVRTDLIDFLVDRNPYKHGRFTPGTRIPILPPDALWQARPDYVLILPWNLKAEIMEQLAGIRDWGGRFVLPLPDLRVI